MRGILLGVVSKIKSGYNPDFVAKVINVALDKGYDIPPDNTLLRINDLYTSLQSNNLLSKFDTFANFAIGISGYNNFRLIDWIRENAVYETLGGVTYNSFGAVGDGINGYIDTKFNPSTSGSNYTLNNASRGFFILQSSETGSNVITEASGTTATNRTNMNVGGSAVQRINSGSTNISSSFDMSGDGFKYIGRNNSTSTTIINNTTASTFTQNSSSINNGNQLLLRTQGLYSTNTLMCYFMGSYLTESEALLFRSIYNDYITGF